MKTNLNNLSEEELLKALNGSNQSSTVVNDFNGFIQTFDLKPGPNKIATRVLFNLYKKWSKDPLTKQKFSKNLNMLFENSKSNVLVNMNPLDLIQVLDNNKRSVPSLKNSPTVKKHFEAFLKKYEIENGSLFIKFSIIYDAYDKWRYQNKLKTQIAKLSLEEYMRLYFKSKKDFNNVYFAVDSKILNNLTPEQKLQCLSQKSKLNAIKKENQKKSN